MWRPIIEILTLIGLGKQLWMILKEILVDVFFFLFFLLNYPRNIQ